MHPAKTVFLASRANLVAPVALDMHQESARNLMLHLAEPVHQVHLDHREPLAAKDLQVAADHPDPLDNQGPRDPRVKQEQRDPPDNLDEQDPKENLDPMLSPFPILLVTKGHKDDLVPRVRLENKDHKDDLDQLDNLDDQETQDPKDDLVPLDGLVLVGHRDLLAVLELVATAHLALPVHFRIPLL